MKLTGMLAAATAALCVVAGASSALAIEVDIAASSPTGTDVTLGAGVYDVSEIAGAYVSADLWESGVGPDGFIPAVGGCSTPSDCGVGYRPSFDISINGGPATSYSVPTPASGYPATYETAAGALAAFQAYEAVNPITFTLTAPTTVNFVVPDLPGEYWDNTGGISLSVVSATPEPSTWMLTIGAIGGIGFMLRRSKKSGFDRLDEVAAT